MYSISKMFSFDCAHKLNGLEYSHPCGNIHGHSYNIEVIITTEELNSNGFIIDFSKLKVFQEFLNKHFDHALVLTHDDVFADYFDQKISYLPEQYNNTSSENLAHYFSNEFLELMKHFNESVNFKTVTVKVWETKNNYASYTIKI